MSEVQPEIKIGISNLNLPRREIALADVDRMGQILDFIDPERELLTHGFELTPTRMIMVTAGKLRGLSPDEIFYSSVHQSWGQGLFGGLKSLLKKDLVGAGGGVLLEEQHASLAGLTKLAETTDYHVPGVVFANHRHRGKPVKFKDYRFKWVGTQPSAEMDEVLYAGHNPDALAESYQRNGIDETIWDNHHAIRPHKKFPELKPRLDDVVEAVKRTGKPIGAFHASAGRYDTAEDEVTRKHTEQDLEGLINDNIAATRMGEVLMAGYEISRPEYAILEVPYGSVADHVKNDKDFYDLTFDMAGNLKNFLAGIDCPTTKLD